MNSKRKGARGELEWSKYLTAGGFEARRGQQFSGSTDFPDVVCTDLQAFHCEVKRVERLNIQDAIDQAIRDAADKIPYVAHRRNDCAWLVTMRAHDWLALVRETLK